MATSHPAAAILLFRDSELKNTLQPPSPAPARTLPNSVPLPCPEPSILRSVCNDPSPVVSQMDQVSYIRASARPKNNFTTKLLPHCPGQPADVTTTASAVQEHGGALVTSVNNTHVLLLPPSCNQQVAHPPAAAPSVAASVIAPSNTYRHKYRYSLPQNNTFYFTERGRWTRKKQLLE